MDPRPILILVDPSRTKASTRIKGKGKLKREKIMPHYHAYRTTVTLAVTPLLFPPGHGSTLHRHTAEPYPDNPIETNRYNWWVPFLPTHVRLITNCRSLDHYCSSEFLIGVPVKCGVLVVPDDGYNVTRHA